MLFLFSFSSRLDEYFFQKKKGLWVELVLSFSFPFSCLVKYVDPGSLFFLYSPRLSFSLIEVPLVARGQFLFVLFFTLLFKLSWDSLSPHDLGGGRASSLYMSSFLLFSTKSIFFFLYSVGLGIS